MIAIDTNLLIYAHREDSPWHHEDGGGGKLELRIGQNPFELIQDIWREQKLVVTFQAQAYGSMRGTAPAES